MKIIFRPSFLLENKTLFWGIIATFVIIILVTIFLIVKEVKKK